MELQKKICKYCGKQEEMAKSCDTCLDCRIKLSKKVKTNSPRKYYWANREKILEELRKRRAKERAAGIKFAWPKEKAEKPRWTVEYIKTEGGYMWRAWFRNPATERLVKFESDEVFDTIALAKQDYCKATR